MSEPNVVPILDTLKALGFNAKDWLIKMAKSKTLWFSTALTLFGVLETYLQPFQAQLGNWGGFVLTGVGVVTALLRFATTNAISDK